LNAGTSTSTPRVAIAPTFSTPRPFGLCELGPVVAVVEQVADADVAEPVELRADLAELAADDLVVVHHVVRAHGPERLRNPQAEVPRAEQRHPGLVDVPELVHRASLDQVLRFEHLGRRELVGRAALIGGAPARGIPAVGLAERRGGDGGGDAGCEQPTRARVYDRRELRHRGSSRVGAARGVWAL
jgi:hypothetical protein